MNGLRWPLARLVEATVPLVAAPNSSATFPGRNGLIAYAHDVGGGSGFDIFTVDPEHGRVRRVTAAAGDDKAPSWSPDGRRIAFESTRGGATSAIYVITPTARTRRA